MTNSVVSPCVRKCCLDDEDVCVGCGRNIDEICRWTQYDDSERDALMVIAKQRLDDFKKVS